VTDVGRKSYASATSRVAERPAFLCPLLGCGMFFLFPRSGYVPDADAHSRSKNLCWCWASWATIVGVPRAILQRLNEPQMEAAQIVKSPGYRRREVMCKQRFQIETPATREGDAG